MDKIILNDMLFYGYHGVLLEETKLGQKFRVDIELFLNLAAAGRTDDLTTTVSYVDVFQLCKALVEGTPCKLIETLAESIASEVLASFEQVDVCAVKVVKENPPIPGLLGAATIQIERKQLRHNVYLSLGTNIGERESLLLDALFKMNTHPEVKVVRRSPVYETEPVGFTDQATFLNVVIQVQTALTPQQLLSHCQDIEHLLGRKRSIRWGPRTMDIDILLYDELIIQEESLTIPHPRMHERSFVLAPLADLDPELMIPRQQQTVSDLASELPDREGVHKWDKDLEN